MKKNIILLIVSTGLMLIIAEMAIRASGIYKSYTERSGGRYSSPYACINQSWYYALSPHKPFSQYKKEFTTTWTANNEGLKDKDFSIAKKDLRIMILGDSYTEGVGAANDSSFPRQLSYLLADSFHQASEVWSCGLSGSDPIYEFRLFNDKLLKYDPDMVMVVINFTDIDDAMARGGFERFRPDGSVHYKNEPWFEPLYAHSHIARAFVHFIFGYNRLFIKSQDAPIRKQEAISNLETAIDSFTRVCTQKNIKLLFVFHPNEPDIKNRNKYEVTPLISYCQKKKLSYIDIRQQLYQMGIDSSNAHHLFWPIDGHCNNKGYEYFALSIYRNITPELEELIR